MRLLRRSALKFQRETLKKETILQLGLLCDVSAPLNCGLDKNRLIFRYNITLKQLTDATLAKTSRIVNHDYNQNCITLQTGSVFLLYQQFDCATYKVSAGYVSNSSGYRPMNLEQSKPILLLLAMLLLPLI